ncbi:MAG TPA: hypothetical protein VGW80_04475 [Solirubrobacterales bacterium]|jgi:hypothetical protein|nr:hypothetical protein [Solirubrobacterales bacterium]
MKSFNFTLIFEGLDELDEEVVNALYEAGCDDALFGERHATPFGEFDREAPNFSTAVWSAIRTVESAVPALRVVRVEPDDLVSLTVIASRTGRSRESVRLLASGKRGPGGFPEPLAWIDASTRVWQWSNVAIWFNEKMEEDVKLDAGAPQFIAALNGSLEARRQIASLASIVAAEPASHLAFSQEAIDDLPQLVDQGVSAVRKELATA